MAFAIGLARARNDLAGALTLLEKLESLSAGSDTQMTQIGVGMMSETDAFKAEKGSAW